MSEIKIPAESCLKKTLKLDDDLKLYDTLIQIVCILSNKTLPFAERSLLSYYAKYGINAETEQKYIEDFNRNKQIISNLKYSLKNKGFLYKHENLNVHELPVFLKKRLTHLNVLIELDARK